MPTESPRPLVLYDVTRLVNRRRASNPTGIDRIDLELAAATFARFGADCLPVVLVGRHPVVLADERATIVDLLGGLGAAWSRGTAPDEAVAARIDRLGVAANNGHGARRVEREVAARRRGPGDPGEGPARLARRFARFVRLARSGFSGTAVLGGRRVLYVNASHEGAARLPGALDRLARRADLAVLAYVHDLMPLEVPQFSRADRIAAFGAFIGELVRHRATFVANSRATAAALARHLEAVAPGAFPVLEVVHPGIERPQNAAAMRAASATTADFIVLGTIEPRKNHKMLLAIWREMIAENDAPIPRLRIIGRRGWDIDEVTAELDGWAGRSDHVIEESGLDDDAVRARLRDATALLFPSFAEGFGLPLAEAAALGVPVIASDLPVFREIVTDGLVALPPDDAAAWKAAIRAAAADPMGLPAPHLSEELLDWPTQSRLFTDLVEKALR